MRYGGSGGIAMIELEKANEFETSVAKLMNGKPVTGEVELGKKKNIIKWLPSIVQKFDFGPRAVRIVD